MKRVILFWLLIMCSIIHAQQFHPANGIIYVRPQAMGLQDGSSWDNATDQLYLAATANNHINPITKIYVAVGNYDIFSTTSFKMRSSLEIYGGFDPEHGITDLTHNRILPNKGMGDGSVLNGKNLRPVVWNEPNYDANPVIYVGVTAVLDGFTITGGKGGKGGGIHNKDAQPTLRNLVIKGNTTTENGGGIYNENSSPTLVDVVIKDNTAVNGGGMFTLKEQPNLTNVIIKDNIASAYGGGIYNDNLAHPVLKNVLIAGNSAGTDSGSGIYSSDSFTTGLRLINCTVPDNDVIINSGNNEIYNSIIYGNMVVGTLNFTTFTSKHSLIKGKTSTADGNISSAGITVDDIFKNPAAKNYALKTASPVTNKGDNGLFPDLNTNTKDLAGNPRLFGSAIDLGAYESGFTPDANGIIYVKPDGTGNGSSWNDTTNDLRNAIHVPGVQKVFAAIGNYDVGDQSFVMKNGVTIYGGFDPANGITDLTHNRILPTETITGSVLNGKNQKPVIWNEFTSAAPLNNTAVLDGFTIYHGRNNSYGGDGAGMRNVYASPTLNNLVFINNIGNKGGGIFNSNSSPKLNRISLLNNQAAADGGGMYNDGTSAPEIMNSIIKGNQAQQGGGMYNFNTVTMTVTNTLITGNSASYGSGIYNETGNNIFTNVTIADNLFIISPVDFKLNNSIVFGAVTGNSNNGYTAKNSLIQGNTDFSNGNFDPTGLAPADIFTNPSAGDYTLKSGSPAINAGSNTLYPNLTINTKDLAGNPRVHNFSDEGVIDMGAYESEYNSSVTPDANDIVYVKPEGTGLRNGKSWNNATSDLHNAIHTPGVQKVFVAKGNYNVGNHSFTMKNNVAIYGGFDPELGITDLTHNRILPNKGMGDGSVLNGQNARPVIWNDFTSATALDNTAVLDGFTITKGKGQEGGGIHNIYASPIFSNLVIKENKTFDDTNILNNGGGIYSESSSPALTNVIIKDNTGGGLYSQKSSPVLTNVQITGNISWHDAGGITHISSGGIPPMILTNVLIADNIGRSLFTTGGIYNADVSSIEMNNVTMVNNLRIIPDGGSTLTTAETINNTNSTITAKNSIIYGIITSNNNLFTTQYSLIEGNTNTADGNLDVAGLTPANIFTDPANGDYTLKFGSAAVNAGSNILYPNLNVNTKDLEGNPRVHNFATGGIIDLGAYESFYTPIVPDNGIVYVKPDGTGNGSSWNEATDDLHNAILTNGVQKVFAAIGNYNVGSSSFIMKNGVEIYGGFDPANGITDLSHNRIMPNPANTQGSVLNGENTRPVIWNVFTSGTAMNNTAVLDGFTVYNGSYFNGAGIRNVYASPTLQNLVIRGNTSTGTGAGIYNENSNPDIYNTVISGNMIVAPFNQSGIGAGIYNHTNSAPTIVNTTIVNNTITGIGSSPVMVGAGVANLTGAAPKIYNSIIWNNQKNGVANTAGADIENNSATITLKNSITQLYNTGDSADNNKVNENPVFTGTDFKLQATSPAINSGSNSLYPNLSANTKDLSGNTRVYNFSGGGIIDMGAYEYQPVTIWTNNSGTLEWLNGLPDSTKDAIIDADYDGAAFEARNLTVNSDKKLTVISSVKAVDITNNGTIEVANGGNFLQTGTFTDGVNSKFAVRADSKPVIRLGYAAWSSPLSVSSQTLKAFSYGRLADGITNQSAAGTLDNRFYTYNNGGYHSTPATGNFVAGQGFQIRTPNDFTSTPQIFHGYFEGTKPNSGDITYDASSVTGNYVFLGNPYPGALDIDQFLSDNNFTSTIYIWNSQAVQNAAATGYEGTLYHTYSGAGSNPVNMINGKIAAGQGFFVERGGLALPSFVFKNGARTTTSGLFNKSASMDRFWLELESVSGGATSQLLLAFHSQGTPGFDSGWDAKLVQMTPDVMYTTVDGTLNLVTDVHNSFVNTDKFWVNMNASASGSYRISLAAKDGIFTSGQKIYIKDHTAGITTDLSQNDYNFTSTGGVEPNRFEIFFDQQPGVILGTQEQSVKEVEIYGAHETVYVKAEKNIESVKVYDLSGRLIKSMEKTNGNSVEIQVSAVKMVLVSAELADGKVISKKIKL